MGCHIGAPLLEITRFDRNCNLRPWFQQKFGLYYLPASLSFYLVLLCCVDLLTCPCSKVIDGNLGD